MGAIDDFCYEPLDVVLTKVTRNDIKAQVIEYYKAHPSFSLEQIGQLFKVNTPLVSNIVSSYFQYTGSHYEILVLQSKV